jgi:hypothetical protein
MSDEAAAVENLDLGQAPREYSVEKHLDIRDRIEKYATIKSFLDSIDKPLNFCDCNNSEIEQLNDETSTSVCPKIQIVSQIGSNSVAGVVYKIIMHNIQSAMKVMPVTNDDLLIQNEKEINIANICSQLVISGQSIFFPIVYGSYSCNNIKYKNGTKFLLDSLNYSISKILYNTIVDILTENQIESQRMIKIALKRFQTNSSNTNVEYDRSNPELFVEKMIQVVNNFFKSNKIEIPEINKANYLSGEAYEKMIPKLKGSILISEIANADIVNYSKDFIIERRILPNEKWISIIEGVLLGIRDMQKQNIIHKDLHPGNVLVLIKNKENDIIPLIHDFGNSEIIQTWSIEDTRSFDIITFLDRLIKYELDFVKPETGEPAKITDSMSPEFLEFTKKFLSDIQSQSDNTPDFMDIIIQMFNSETKSLIRGGHNKKTYFKNTKKIRRKYNSKKKHKSRRIIGKKK